MNETASTIGVMGCGTWGISLACVLRWKGYRVKAWDIDQSLLELIERERRHPKLTELDVPEGLEVFAQGQPGIRLSRVMDNTGSVSAFWYVGWLEVSPGGAVLKPANMQLFDTRSPPTGDGWPSLQDPP